MTTKVKPPTPEKIAQLKEHLERLQSIQWDFTLLQRDMIDKGNRYGDWLSTFEGIENQLFEAAYLLECHIADGEGRVS